MPAKSAGLPQRPAGVRARTRSCRPSTCLRALRVRAVSIQPGSTALTWMLSFAHAVAMARLSCTMPPLLAAYGAVNEAPKIDIIEPILITLPPPARRISGYAAWLNRKALVRLVSITACHSAAVYSCGCLRILLPALLTRMSSRPNFATVSLISPRQAPSLQTSTLVDAAFAPRPASSFTAALLLAASRPAIITAAPAWASPRAMPSPMPPLPPVTIATRPGTASRVMVSPVSAEALAAVDVDELAGHRVALGGCEIDQRPDQVGGGDVLGDGPRPPERVSLPRVRPELALPPPLPHHAVAQPL